MEKIMQRMWQWRLYGEPDKRLTDGRPIRIVHPGTLNTSSGPDFFNARVDIDGICWVGNVELHLKATDWHRHGHDTDMSYDSVILHVVGDSDTLISRQDGSQIPQLEMPFNADTAALYSTLTTGSLPIRCASRFSKVPRIHLIDCIERAGIERLHIKSDRFRAGVEGASGDWMQGLFIVLARALGFGLNGEPFERLARSLPLNIVAKHADSLFQLEALLMGYAGLLGVPAIPGDAGYYSSLQQEFSFLAHKYSLTPLPASLWKMSGSRPGNMPHRKLATLARLLQNIQSLFSKILAAKGDVEQLSELFKVEFEGYWENHFTFGNETTRAYKTAISPDMIKVVLINVVVPVYYAYGIYSGDYELQEIAEKTLRSLPAERNSIIKMWHDVAGYEPVNAFESQALLHIKREYCERGECMRCRIGCKLLRITTLKTPILF